MTRRAALEFWSRSVSTFSLFATSVVALTTAFHGAPFPLDTALEGLALVGVLPAVWVALARLAERRYLSRPPKAFLAASLGLDCGGLLLVAAAIALLQSHALDAGTLLRAGGVLEGCGTVLLVAWFVAVLAVEPSGDHMRGL
ncbi:MAG TPA: hypothetical protein PLB01_11420 [Thermoanaerobaculia bacterium]|nr:hypothetical protein [Thermoanaerobaculia bacterium]